MLIINQLVGFNTGNYLRRIDLPIITSTLYEYNARAMVDLLGYDGILPVLVNIEIDVGGVLGSSSTTIPAFKRGVFPFGSIIRLTNLGRIQGKGGAGGLGSSAPGGAGGVALDSSDGPMQIVNAAGLILGGGGGGGGGNPVTATGGSEKGESPWSATGGGGDGGGGAGTDPGLSGNGTAGTATGGGSGGPGRTSYAYGSGGKSGGGALLGSATGNPGAAGGGPGLPGIATLGAGGAAGAAVVGNSNITWISTGTRSGPIT